MPCLEGRIVKTTIRVGGLKLSCVIGVSEAERIKRQPVSADLRLTYEADQAIATDDISKALDYQKIVQKVEALASSSAFKLLESLGACIGQGLLDDFPMLDTVTIRLSKPEVKILFEQELEKVEAELTFKR